MLIFISLFNLYIWTNKLCNWNACNVNKTTKLSIPNVYLKCRKFSYFHIFCKYKIHLNTGLSYVALKRLILYMSKHKFAIFFLRNKQLLIQMSIYKHLTFFRVFTILKNKNHNKTGSINNFFISYTSVLHIKNNLSHLWLTNVECPDLLFNL